MSLDSGAKEGLSQEVLVKLGREERRKSPRQLELHLKGHEWEGVQTGAVRAQRRREAGSWGWRGGEVMACCNSWGRKESDTTEAI